MSAKYVTEATKTALLRRDILLGWRAHLLLVVILSGDIATADILPLLALVQAVEDLVDGVVEGNVVEESSGEDGTNENRVAAENGVVKARSERLS